MHIQEATTDEIGSLRVGCGNLWEREFETADGQTYTAMSARLSMGGVVLEVHVGSRFRIDHVNYRVSAIDKPDGARGHVTIEALE